MVSRYPRFKPTTKDHQDLVNGRLYSTTNAKGKAVTKGIHTLSNRKGRSPRLDTVLGDPERQPYIHSTRVQIEHSNKISTFYIFFKNHKCLPINLAVGKHFAANSNRTWKGDVLVMRAGKKNSKTVVGLQSGDVSLANFAMKNFLVCVQQKAKLRVPKLLKFTKP